MQTRGRICMAGLRRYRGGWSATSSKAGSKLISRYGTPTRTISSRFSRPRSCSETKSGQMPLPQYRMIHWNARITDADLEAFTQWTRDTATVEVGRCRSEAIPSGARRSSRSAAPAATRWNRIEKAQDCRGSLGEPRGRCPGFPYSQALVKAAIVWNESSLEQWLTDPDSLVPGNNMDFHVAKAQERTDLISYLKQASSK